MRAAPLPSARVVVVVGFLWGSPTRLRADVTFGLVRLHRSTCVHRPPVTSPWLTRLRVGTCGGVASSTARLAPGASPLWGGSRRRRGLDHGGLAGSEGSPGPAPGCGPPGGPNHPIMGPGRSEARAPRASSSPETRGARHPIHTHTRRETQPSQFKRPEDLYEDRRVPDVHIVSGCLRLPVPCLQKEYRFVNASLNGGRQPPFARRDTREAVRVRPHLRHCELNVLAHALRRTCVPIRDHNVAPPAPRSREKRHQGHRAADSRHLRQRGCTTRSIAYIQKRN